jgi:hypothetical protein
MKGYWRKSHETFDEKLIEDTRIRFMVHFLGELNGKNEEAS